MKKRFIAIGAIVLVLALCIGVVALLVVKHQRDEEERRKYCMGIGLISQEEAVKYDYYSSFKIEKLSYNGMPVVFDRKSWSIYISLTEESLVDYYDLPGKLEWTDPYSKIAFVKNEALMNIRESVRNNIPLTMYITDGKTYRFVNVVITTMPVVHMTGKVTHKDEDNRDVYTGNLTVYNGQEPGKYSVQTSKLEWHVRGNTTAKKDKKPWKLSLKDENGDNNHLEFLGMGADDDWILNCLTMDDTKMKEKLYMDYWNDLASQTEHNFKMSTGEYVEVVINNQYLGLFLLQRRVDAKYLELNDNDVLLKVVNYGLTKAEDAYEFVTDPVNEKQIYATMQKVLDQKDSSMYNLSNMIDTNLMMQFTSALDNQGLKNMFHVLIPSGSGYTHYFVPWDTDQSLGVVWSHEKSDFAYDFIRSKTERVQRKETVAMAKLRPDYYQLEAVRWFELREKFLIEEDILAYIDDTYESMNACGVFARDTKLWGERYKGSDTVENLKRFISARLAYLDDYYTKLLP
ncbi:MAG: hypothetical protein E7439_00530 [Ruminococcaceae bacterium]|nr:hypothetical protein [Oscillospiraceae bacterium]